MMMNRKLAFAALSTLFFAACEVGTDAEISDELSPGVQDPDQPVSFNRGCATQDLSDAQREQVERDLALVDGSASLTASRQIPVYWHTIQSSTGAGGVTS